MSDRIAELMNQLNEFLDIVCDDVSSEKYDWASRRGSELIERLEKEIIKENIYVSHKVHVLVILR